MSSSDESATNPEGKQEATMRAMETLEQMINRLEK